MRIYYDENRAQQEPRLFPYAARESEHSDYTDFTQSPELIETCLEDCRPHANTPAVKTFYDFLRWVNGKESHLMTCDCALRSPTEHSDKNSNYRLCVHGRLFILFRHLEYNTQLEKSNWLCGRMMNELRVIDANLSGAIGVVAFTKQPALHTELSNGEWRENGLFESGEFDPGMGHHLMLSFWGYGSSDKDAFESLRRVFENIWRATRSISLLIDEAEQ